MRSAKASPSSTLLTSCDCGSFQADLPHRVLEEQPVLGLLDGFDFGADQLDAVLVEHAGFGQLHGKIEAGLAADGGEQSIRTFAANHFFGEGDAERLDVGAVGQLGIGHDGGRIGIDQHHFVAVGLERLAGLRAGIVELAGLADDDRAGADDQDAMEVVAAGHSGCTRRIDGGSPYQLHEVVEQIVRIVRAGRGLGVILDAEDRLVAMAETFQRLVVQVDVRELDFVLVERVGVHREAVIVRGDLHFVRDLVQHRMIRAAMSELEFVGFAAQREAEDLMAQANSEDGLLSDQFANLLRLKSQRLGIAGTVGEENAVRVEAQDVFCMRKMRYGSVSLAPNASKITGACLRLVC